MKVFTLDLSPVNGVGLLMLSSFEPLFGVSVFIGPGAIGGRIGGCEGKVEKMEGYGSRIVTCSSVGFLSGSTKNDAESSGFKFGS